MGLRAFRFRGSGFKMFSCLGLSAVVRQGVVAFFVIRVSVKILEYGLARLASIAFGGLGFVRATRHECHLEFLSLWIRVSGLG